VTPACPTADEIAAVVAGTGSASTDEHISACRTCQARLAALTDDPVADRARRAVAAGLVDPHSSPTEVGFRGPASRDRRTPEPGSRNPPPPLVPGYEIGREVGRGGMGVVYLARQVRIGRQVALKVMTAAVPPTDPDWAERFAREAIALGRVRHPNIVMVHDAGTAGVPFLAMEFVDGGTLADRMAAGPLPVREAVGLVRDAALGVAAAHAAGVVHRDLKPSNVLIQHGPAGPVAKVVDFGLAKLADHSGRPTKSGQSVGTPGYMAPEQTGLADGEVGPPADVFALGAVLYQALTGLAPFRDEDPLALLTQVVSADPVRPRAVRPGIPRDVETVCLKCLEKRPRNRYPSAVELADDLSRYLDGRPVTARPAGWLRKVGVFAARRPTVVVLAAVCVAYVAVGLGAWARHTADVRAALAAEQAANARTRSALDALSSDGLQSLLQARPTPTAADRKYLTELRDLYQGSAAGGADRVEGLIRVGMIQRKLGEAAEAEATLRESVAAAPAGTGGRGRAVLELAYLLRDGKRPAEVIALVEGLRADDRGGPAATPADAAERATLAHVLGSAFLAVGRYSDAAASFLAAMVAADGWRADPGCREKAYRAASWLGEAYVKAGRSAEAEAAYKDCLARVRAYLRDAPADRPAAVCEAETLTDLAGLAWDRQRTAEAETYHRDGLRAFARVVAADPTDPDPRYALAREGLALGRRLRGLGRTADAEGRFRDALPVAALLTAEFPGVRRYAPLHARLLTEVALVRVAADPAAAAEFADRAAAVARPWLARPEGRAEAAEVVGAALRVKADALEKANDPAGAAECRAEADRLAAK
jgi:tetratricopeptide (TPR) repeat protein